jgi:hypothetical protein
VGEKEGFGIFTEVAAAVLAGVGPLVPNGPKHLSFPRVYPFFYFFSLHDCV